MKRCFLAVITFVVTAFLLTACVPGANVVSPPSFALVAEASGLVRLEPPGVGRGAAVFRVALDVTNPNPIPVAVAGADANFVLAGRGVAQSRVRDGLALAANGTSRWTIDVEVPMAEAPHLVGQLARLFTGDRVPYRLEGSLTLDVFGTSQQTPLLTIAQGELEPPGPLPLPSVRFDAAASEVRLEGLTVVVEAGLAIRNDAWIGYRVEGPSLLVMLDGRPVGRASFPGASVPALGETTAVLRAEASIVDLGTALVTRLQGGGTLQVSVDGALAFSVPGVAQASLDLARVAGPIR